jgi:hypothetical protein
VRILVERLQEIEGERKGFFRLAARGSMSDEELDAAVAEVDGQRESVQKALREAQIRRDALQTPKINMAHLDSLLLQLNAMDLGMASMEDRRRLYRALRLQVSIDNERQMRISGIFDPDLYFHEVLQDPPDWLTPRPEVWEQAKVVVTTNSSSSPTTSR